MGNNGKIMHTLGRSNRGLLGPGAGGVALGPGLFPKTVQKMWRGLDPSVSRDSHCAQPWAGRQVPLLSLKLHVCFTAFAHKHQTPGSWFSSTTRSPVDLELQKQLVALELSRSRYMTAAWERNKQDPWHSGFRGPPANTSKHRTNLACFCWDTSVSHSVSTGEHGAMLRGWRESKVRDLPLLSVS